MRESPDDRRKAVGFLPILRYVWIWVASGGARWVGDPAAWLGTTFFFWSLPGFLLAYGAVKLAQRAGDS